MTYPSDLTPAQSGPHPQAQPHPNGGLARLVGSVAGSNLSKSVRDKVDLAYRQLKNMGDSAGNLFAARSPNKNATPRAGGCPG
jgi:ubiquinone biosynthesis protein UbiJ